MVDRREAGVAFAGLAVGALVLLIVGFALTPPAGLADGRNVSVNGTVTEVSPEQNLLALNDTDTVGGALEVTITAASVPYECGMGGALFSCASRGTWDWIEPGTRVCLEATVPDRGAPIVSALYVDATCDEVPETP